MISDKEFGKLIAMTEANSDAICRTNSLVDKNRSNIVWLYRFGVTVLLGILINALVVPGIKGWKDRNETVKEGTSKTADTPKLVECVDYIKNLKK